MKTYDNLAAYAADKGKDIGASDWFEIDQKRIQDFAEATGDFQWIHLDAERTQKELNMPTIAHGYLTLSLLPKLSSEISAIKSVTRGINYGANRLRFTGMVPSGSRVRLRSKLLNVEDKAGGKLFTSEVTMEVEGQDRPALVAETLSLLYE